MAHPATPQQLFAELIRLQIEHHTHSHPPVFTVEEAKQHRNETAGGHTKNLFLKDRKEKLFLAVTLEDVSVNLKELAPLIGASGKLSFASAERLMENLGVEPGAVTPFSLINDIAHCVTPVLDQAMLDVTPLNFHPLANTATTRVATSDLLRFIAAQGHTPLCLHFPRRLQNAISQA